MERSAWTTTQDAGSEEATLYGYTLGSGVPTGERTVEVGVTSDHTKQAIAITVTADSDITVETTEAFVSAMAENPFVTLATGASTECFVSGVCHSGRLASAVAPGGDYTQLLEAAVTTVDGTSTGNWVRRTNNSSGGNVTVDWSMAADEASIIAIALAESDTAETISRTNQDTTTFSDSQARDFWGDRLL
jgi:hypothetical protein